MNAIALLVADLSQELTLTLVHVTWTGTVLAALAGIVSRYLPKRSSAAQYWVSFGTLVGMVLLLPICGTVVHVRFMQSNRHYVASSVPLASVALRGENDALDQSTPPPDSTGIDSSLRGHGLRPMLSRTPVSSDVGTSDPTTRTGRDSRAWRESAAQIVTATYLLGLCVMLVWLLVAVRGGERLRLAGVLLTDSVLLQTVAQKSRCLGLRVVPLLRSCEQVAVPVVVGTLRPVILIPAAIVRGLPFKQLVAVLVHELAHVRRYDHWMLLVQRLVEAFLFFHPAVWHLSRAVDAKREDCCDDLVLASGSDPADYVASLLHVAEMQVTISELTGRVSLLAADGRQPSHLRRRIARVLGAGAEPAVRLTRAGFLTLTMALSGAIVGVTLFPAFAQPSNDARSQDGSVVAPQNQHPKTQEADRRPPIREELFAISGRVLGPDGKPFKGAKLYAVISSAESKPLRLKDSNKPPFATEERKGQAPLLKCVHPKVIELFKQLDIETPVAADDPRLRSREYETAFAKLVMEIYDLNPALVPTVRAASGEDGHFCFSLPTSDLKAPFEEDISVVAVADGLGPAWNLSRAPGSLVDVQLRLADDMPIRGRIVDTRGKPVANAKIKMGSIIASPDGTGEIWVETVLALATGTTTKFNELLTKVLREYQFFGQRLQLFPDEFATDADGRFTITGVGAGRAVFKLEVSGPGVASDSFSVMTRRGPGIDLNNLRDPNRRESSEFRDPILHEYRTYGATFEHVVQPVRLVVGTVRDLAAGLPVENVQIAAWSPSYIDTFTDAKGKYQLTGLAPRDRYEVTAWPWENRRSRLPYVTISKTVQAEGDQGPVTADFDLVRGVILRGKLTDPATGKPVAKATIWYAAFKGNPLLATFYYPGNPLFRDWRDYLHRPAVQRRPLNVPAITQTHAESGIDGTFDMIVLPGRGVLGACPAEDQSPSDRLAKQNQYSQLRATVPDLAQGFPFVGIKLIAVPDDEKEMQVDFPMELQPIK